MDTELNDEQFAADLGMAAELATPPPTLVLHDVALRRGTQLRRRRTARTVLAGAGLTAAVVVGVYAATATSPRTVNAAMPAAQPSATAAHAAATPPASPVPTPSSPAGSVPRSVAQQAADVVTSLLPSGDTAQLAAPGGGPATSAQALTLGTTGVGADFEVATPQGQRRLIVSVSRLSTPASCPTVPSGDQTCLSSRLDGGTLVVTSDPANTQAGKVPVVSYAWNAPGGVLVSAQEWSDNGSAAAWLNSAQVHALLTSSKWHQVTSQLPAPAAGSSDSGTYCTKSC